MTVQSNQQPGATRPVFAGPLSLLVTTDVGGFAYVNGTPTILSWTAPQDGQLHRVCVFAGGQVGVTQVGGAVTLAAQNPSGGNAVTQLDPGGHAVGAIVFATPKFLIVESGGLVTVQQSSAMTSGTATLWAELWGS